MGGDKKLTVHQTFVYMYFCYILRARQLFIFFGGVQILYTPLLSLDTALKDIFPLSHTMGLQVIKNLKMELGAVGELYSAR